LSQNGYDYGFVTSFFKHRLQSSSAFLGVSSKKASKKKRKKESKKAFLSRFSS